VIHAAEPNDAASRQPREGGSPHSGHWLPFRVAAGGEHWRKQDQRRASDHGLTQLDGIVDSRSMPPGFIGDRQSSRPAKSLQQADQLSPLTPAKLMMKD